MNRLRVFDAISTERDFQDKKWGTIPEHPHEVGAWILIMQKLLRDAETAWCESNGDYKAMLEIRKVLAVGVACAEQHGLPTRSTSHSVEGE